MEIQHLMCEEATRQNLTCGPNQRKVQSFRDVILSYKENKSDDHLKKIWEVAFGWFDTNEGWAKELADRFMKRYKWEYILENIPDKKRTYCVEQQITLIKVELVKYMNRAAKLAHGRQVGISRKGDEITKETKFEKRKKSVFKVQYITSHVSPIMIRCLLADDMYT